MQVILNGAEESVAATTLAELCIEKKVFDSKSCC